MEMIDRHAIPNLRKYLKQSFMGTVVIVMIIFALDAAVHTVIIATLGATTFIVFAMPHSYASEPRRIFGGYAVGIIVGIIVHYLHIFFLFLDPDGFEGINVLLGGLAIGLSTLLMAFTNTEHPPAAGFSMGLIFNPWTFETLGVVVGAITFLSLSKYVLKNWLINLHGPTPQEHCPVGEDKLENS